MIPKDAMKLTYTYVYESGEKAKINPINDNLSYGLSYDIIIAKHRRDGKIS